MTTATKPRPICLDCGKPVDHKYDYARCTACHRALPRGEAGKQRNLQSLAARLGIQSTDERVLAREWAKQVREGRA